MTAQDLYDKCFNQVWPSVQDLYHAKEVELIYSADTGAESLVVTDADLFKQVLNLLLQSALTQTLRGTEVRISIGAAHQQIVVSVRDHGPGMEAAQAQKLYGIDQLLQLGGKCQVNSREFIDYPDNHGTTVTVQI